MNKSPEQTHNGKLWYFFAQKPQKNKGKNTQPPFASVRKEALKTTLKRPKCQQRQIIADP